MYSCFVEGRTQDAVAYARRALERDPLSSDLNTRLGTFLYHAREYDEAIELLRRVLERDPTYADAENWLFHTLAHTGRIDEVEAMNPLAAPSYMMGYLIAGRHEEARRIAQAVLDRHAPFAALNNFETRSAFMSQIRVDPRLDL